VSDSPADWGGNRRNARLRDSAVLRRGGRLNGRDDYNDGRVSIYIWMCGIKGEGGHTTARSKDKASSGHSPRLSGSAADSGGSCGDVGVEEVLWALGVW
jgi:hypothetical protein